MKSFPNDETRQSKTDRVYAALKRQIIDNTMKPGMQLVERTLCEYLQSSRTPVREALQRLRNEGLVSSGPRQGSFVSYISYELIQETYDIREVLEGLAARLCTQNADERRIQELGEILGNLKRAKLRGNYDLVAELDIEFHQLIFRESRSQNLVTILMGVFSHARRVTALTRYDQGRAEETLAQHTRLYEAISRRDAPGAERAMKAHIRNSKEYHLANINRYKFLA